MINVIKSNVTALEQEILQYQFYNEKSPKYIIMNGKTKDYFKKMCCSLDIEKINYYSSYMGIPISICEKLQFGEADVV